MHQNVYGYTHSQDIFWLFSYLYRVKHTHSHTRTQSHASACSVHQKQTSVWNSFSHIKRLGLRQPRQLKKNDASNAHTHTRRQTEAKLHTRCGRIWHLMPGDLERNGEWETDRKVKRRDGERTEVDTHMNTAHAMSKSTWDIKKPHSCIVKNKTAAWFHSDRQIHTRSKMWRQDVSPKLWRRETDVKCIKTERNTERSFEEKDSEGKNDKWDGCRGTEGGMRKRNWRGERDRQHCCSVNSLRDASLSLSHRHTSKKT